MAPYYELASMIFRLRMRHRLTQEALALRVGTSSTAISRLETGRHAATVETLRRIAAAFGGRLLIGIELPSTAGPTTQTLARVR